MLGVARILIRCFKDLFFCFGFDFCFFDFDVFDFWFFEVGFWISCCAHDQVVLWLRENSREFFTENSS